MRRFEGIYGTVQNLNTKAPILDSWVTLDAFNSTAKVDPKSGKFFLLTSPGFHMVTGFAKNFEYRLENVQVTVGQMKAIDLMLHESPSNNSIGTMESGDHKKKDPPEPQKKKDPPKLPDPQNLIQAMPDAIMPPLERPHDLHATLAPPDPQVIAPILQGMREQLEDLLKKCGGRIYVERFDKNLISELFFGRKEGRR